MNKRRLINDLNVRPGAFLWALVAALALTSCERGGFEKDGPWEFEYLEGEEAEEAEEARKLLTQYQIERLRDPDSATKTVEEVNETEGRSR